MLRGRSADCFWFGSPPDGRPDALIQRRHPPQKTRHPAPSTALFLIGPPCLPRAFFLFALPCKKAPGEGWGKLLRCYSTTSTPPITRQCPGKVHR